MIGISKVNLIDNNSEFYEYYIDTGKTEIVKNISRKVMKLVKEQSHFCKIGDELGIVSENNYTYKTGSFFTLINKKDKIFTLDSLEIEIPKEYIKKEYKIGFINKTPKFIYYKTNYFNLFD